MDSGLGSAVQEFKNYQLPGIFRVIDWHRGVREFSALMIAAAYG